MIWLMGLPLWVIFWSSFLNEKNHFRMGKNTYMIICSIALVLVLGLRSKFSGTMDTYIYTQLFEGAKNFASFSEYLKFHEIFDGPLVLSEAGFYGYAWILAKLLPGSQWFILVTSAIIVVLTAKFISENSSDPVVSWLAFICLGSMIFAMNGMRQALAMSICLLSYHFLKEKKPLRFFLIVLVAVLFHKSAMFFALVYFMRNMRLNFKSFLFLSVGITLFLVYAQRFAFLYDSLTGEDYAAGESFESGGVVNILIYLIAIAGMILAYKKLKEPENFLPFALVVVGFSMYMGRYISTQIYERISYYFAYFLIPAFPVVIKNTDPKIRSTVRLGFMFMCIVLFAYRISKGAFANFELFW